MRKKYVLVTGSSGTLGTRVCEFLLKKNEPLVCLDDKPNFYSSHVNKHTLKIDLRNGTFLNKESIKEKPIDTIIHLAANARVPHSIKNPIQAKDNFDILYNVLELARAEKVKKFIFISSKDVYGNYKTVLSENDVRLWSCESPYAASKIGGEALVWSYSKCYNLDFLILRIGNVYGLYDEIDRLIPIYIFRAKANDNLLVNGRNKVQDYVYIDDVVNGILLCKRKFSAIRNQVFNIGSGRGVRLLKIAQFIKKELNSRSKIIIKETQKGDVIKNILNISKIKALGFNPKTSINEGLIKTIQWWSDQNNIKKSERRSSK